MPLRFLVVGNTFHALSLYVDDFPLPNMEASVRKCFPKAGGAVFAIASTARRSGVDVSLATLCDSSAETTSVLERLSRSGVDLSLVKRHEGEPNRLVSIYSSSYDRMVYSYLPMQVDASLLENVDISEWDAIFVTCLPFDIADPILTLIRSSSGFSVLVPSGLAPTYFDGTRFMSDADVLVLNKAEAASITGVVSISEIFSVIQLKGCREFVVTSGSSGAFITQDGAPTCVPVERSVPVKHAGGAGDAFAVGFIKGVLEGYDRETACRLGHRLASDILGVVDPTDILQGARVQT